MTNEPPDEKDVSWMRETIQKITGKSGADKVHDDVKSIPGLQDKLSKESSYPDTFSPPNTPNAKKSEDDSARKERTPYERPPGKSK